MKGATVKPYSSAREDRDYLLEYKSIDLASLERVDLLDVPVDNVNRDEAVARIMDMVERKEGPHFVFFADPVKLMQVRPGKKLSFIARDSDLILADGAGLPWAARKLGTPLKERIPLIAFLMDVIRLSVKREFTIYLLGSRMEFLEKVFLNLTRSFPGVRIIGRQGGYFNEERGERIKESLRKSSPDIIFLGMGFPVQELWSRENIQSLSRAVVIGVDGAFDILSGMERKAPDYFQVRGLTWFWRTLIRPMNLIRWFAMMGFYIRTFFRGIKVNRKRRKAQKQAAAEMSATSDS
ncbi:MAG: WecB/TagA/CpsF family glycosyltransferase [Leptospiraceae bacterium]|nr:WecB/TagA/CpsF family glycosyltransferase [Leptospiraceae bacterium]